MMNGNVKKAIQIWQDVPKENITPGILRELGVMHRFEGSGIYDVEKAVSLYE